MEEKQEPKQKPFVHLHVHSEYSLLDGAARIEKLVKVAKEYDMSAIAVTDHGNMYGTIALFDACKKAKIKFIIGTEFYLCDDLTIKQGKTKLAHLILLAKNREGYQNLCMLNSIAFRDGFYYKPRIDYKTLQKHSAGLVCLSACIAGDLPQYLLHNRFDDAVEYARYMQSIFGEDYYIELQDHGLAEERAIYNDLRKIAKDLGIKTVATNDVHYIYKEDAEIQDVLMCVQMAKNLDDPDRMKFPTDEFYLKTREEMEKLFPDNPECIENTIEIADKCNFTFDDIDLNKYYFPTYIAPDGKTALEYFNEVIKKGTIERYGENTSQELRDRIKMEYDLITAQGFVNYFMTVWDFINYARSQGIPVGIGRGSGAGSVIAYVMHITNINPLDYDLLFERFIHTERVSAPDFDIDFADNRRGEVIDYVKRKYGEDRVVKIITFGTMKAKNAIKDVGRVLGVPISKCNMITKEIPKMDDKHNDVIKKVFGFYKSSPDDKNVYTVQSLVDMYNSDTEIQKIVNLAMKLEGMPRQCSTHACGILIGADILDKYIPLGRNGDDIMSQYNMVDLERLGHLKMDFLALRNLNDIFLCLQYVKQNHNIDVDFDTSKYDDPAIFKYIGTGNTEGVFQLESGGFKKFMMDLQPTSIEDIIAGVALYRPGPLQSIPKYVHNKHNPEDIKYLDPVLEKTLNVTYGCIVYQEQVMRIVQDMAGYTLGQADMVRRMMGKKKIDAMKAEKNVFIYGKPAENGKTAIDGAVKRGISEEVASEVWGQMEKFAEYAFNKSHAAAYALISYQTAFLKYYYECEFLTAILNNRITKADEIKHYVNYAKTEDIEILPPNINESDTYFVAGKNQIRFGLAALKGVGESVITSIVEERNKNGNFSDFQDYCERVDSQALNKRVMESLIYSGAFDCFGLKRSQLIESFGKIVDRIMVDKKITEKGQISMFDTILKNDTAIAKIEYPNIREFPLELKLKYEKEVAGMYISGHPLDNYIDKMKDMTFNSSMITTKSDDSEEVVEQDTPDECFIEDSLLNLNNTMISCGGSISEIKKIQTKNGKEMCFLTIEDLYGTFDVVVFPTHYQRYKAILAVDNLVTIFGKLSINDSNVAILAEKITKWKTINNNDEDESDTTLYLKFDINNTDLMIKVQEIMSAYRGSNEIRWVNLDNSTFISPSKCRINLSLLNELYGLLGEANVKMVDKRTK